MRTNVFCKENHESDMAKYSQIHFDKIKLDVIGTDIVFMFTK